MPRRMPNYRAAGDHMLRIHAAAGTRLDARRVPNPARDCDPAELEQRLRQVRPMSRLALTPVSRGARRITARPASLALGALAVILVTATLAFVAGALDQPTLEPAATTSGPPSVGAVGIEIGAA